MSHSDIPEKDVAHYWDKNADLWAELVRKGWDTYREYFNNPAFLKFMGDVKGKKVLDIGCGEGYNTRILARKGAQITGIDISPRMIEHAREHEAQEPLGIQYRIASFSDLSVFDDGGFDLVVSFMALMDSPNLESTSKEIFRVLQSGGSLVFSIVHPCFVTKGLGWIEDPRNGVTRLAVSDYFSDQPWVDHWTFSQAPTDQELPPFEVPSYPRTISYYLNTLLKAGFLLKELHEPRPTLEASLEHPWLQRWRDHAALFFYVNICKQ